MTMRTPCGGGGRLGWAVLLLGALLTPSSSLLVDGGTTEIELLLQKYDLAGNSSTMSMSEGQDLDATLLGKQKCKGTVPYAQNTEERRMWDLINRIMEIIKKYPKAGDEGGGKGGGGGGKDGDCVPGDLVCPADKLDLYKYGGELAEILGKSIPIFFSGLEYFFTKQTARDGDKQFWEDIGKTGKGIGRISKINGHAPGDRQFFMNFLLGYIMGDYDKGKDATFNPGQHGPKDDNGKLEFDYELGYIVGYHRPGGGTEGAEGAISSLVEKSGIGVDIKIDLKVDAPKEDTCYELTGKYCGLTSGMSGISDLHVPTPTTKWRPAIPLWLIFYALGLKPVTRTNENNHMALFGADLMGKLMGKHHSGDIFHKSDGKPYHFFLGGLGKGLDTKFDGNHVPATTDWPQPLRDEPYFWLGFHLGLGTSSMVIRGTDNLDASQGTNINVYNHTGDTDNVYHLYSKTGNFDPKDLVSVKHHDFKSQKVAVHIIQDGMETMCFLIKGGVKIQDDCQGHVA